MSLNSYKKPIYFFSLNTKNKQKAQEQLEIFRKLILLSGGKSSIDKDKNLARLIYNVETQIKY